MQFSIIYSVDVPYDTSIMPYVPKNRWFFTCTESNDQYEYSYLGGIWEKGKHRKYCAVLDKKQFNMLVDQLDFRAENTETMGSIGALGCSYWSPAISFRSDDQEAILNMYVTPIPGFIPKKQLTEQQEIRYWNMIKQAILKMYR